MERLYGEDLRWIDPPSSTSRPTPGDGDDGAVASEAAVSAASTAAAFWSAASDLCEYDYGYQCGRSGGGGDGDDGETSSRRNKIILALPGADPTSARRLCDVLNWLADSIETTAKEDRDGYDDDDDYDDDEHDDKSERRQPRRRQTSSSSVARIRGTEVRAEISEEDGVGGGGRRVPVIVLTRVEGGRIGGRRISEREGEGGGEIAYDDDDESESTTTSELEDEFNLSTLIQ